VAVEHSLIRAVVVRSDDKGGIRAQAGGPSRRADRGDGVVRAGAGDDRHPSAGGMFRDGFDGGGDDAVALLDRECRRLAGRPARNEAVDSGEDLPAHEPAQRPVVERAVRREGRHQRGQRAAESRTSGS
jgi:hypothetical protein